MVILNKCNLEFLKRLNFTDFDMAPIYREKDINPLVSGWRVTKDEGIIDVSIADILGSNIFDRYVHNIPEALDQFFEENSDGYHTRSLGLLKLDRNEIIDRLQSSFRIEPICVTEIEDGKYVISTNGMHRYVVLRLMYLSEVMEAKTDEEIASINERYTIPVEAKTADLEVSYAMYLISAFDLNHEIRGIFTDCDENYRQNGGVVVRFNNGNEVKYTRDQLLDYIKNIDQSIAYPDFFENGDNDKLYHIVRSQESIESFKKFSSLYCPNLQKHITLYSEKVKEEYDKAHVVDYYFGDMKRGGL